MKNNKKFLRQCIDCRKIKRKEDLIRITKDNKTKEIKINKNNKIYGRSVYICKNIECLENAIKKKKFEKILSSNLPESIKEELYAVLKK